MAADVVFTADSPWYTNSYSWNMITEPALRELDDVTRSQYEKYVNVVGIDFTFLPDAKAVEVARWLSGVIKRMLAEGEIGASEAGRAHAEELLRKLHSETQVRDRSRHSPK